MRRWGGGGMLENCQRTVTAPGVCSQCVCVCPLLCVFTLDGLIAEHKFRV